MSALESGHKTDTSFMSHGLGRSELDHLLSERARSYRRIRDDEMQKRARWMAQWRYGHEYQSYHGPEDLVRWLEWFRPVNTLTHYLPQDRVQPLREQSTRWTKEIVGPLVADQYPYEHVDEHNACDFLLQNLYPVPERMRPRRILDFGPGYGRQLNLWSSVPELVYVGLEAIELPYCLQSYYYSRFDPSFHEYLDEPESFRVTDRPGIYHLPTWRDDLLPDSFFDLVICAQVLQEIPAPLARRVAELFGRCVKPGGAVYVRDHDLATQSIHQVDVNVELKNNGFTLEFRPYVIDNTPWKHDLTADIHGIPRIWRRLDGRYPVETLAPDHESIPLQRLRRWLADTDTRYGGFVRRVLQNMRQSRS
jgi:SAM-dependent methyltransferase